MDGLFITFEGGEGSGKTTQIARLADYLKKKGHTVLETREPGGTFVGEAIRSILLSGEEDLAPKTELFLFLANRVQHLEEVILPALQNHTIVLCDRFSDSTLVYQGMVRGIPFEAVNKISHFATEGLEPNMTFLLDINVKKSRARLANREERNRYDLAAEEFHQQIRDGYLALAKKNPNRIRVIRADLPERRVFIEIRKEIDDLLQ
ncbi:MAG: dTMP kinase [Nitrospirota bacterium]